MKLEKGNFSTDIKGDAAAIFLDCMLPNFRPVRKGAAEKLRLKPVAKAVKGKQSHCRISYKTATNLRQNRH